MGAPRRYPRTPGAADMARAVAAAGLAGGVVLAAVPGSRRRARLRRACRVCDPPAGRDVGPLEDRSLVCSGVLARPTGLPGLNEAPAHALSPTGEHRYGRSAPHA